MKKTYMTPTLNVDNALPETLICASFDSNVGLEDDGGSDGDARVNECNWDIWGDE